MAEKVLAREGVQRVVVVERLIAFNDINPATGLGIETVATHLITLCTVPAYARVIGGYIVNDVQAVTPTAASLDIGDAVDDDRYTSTIFNRLSAAGTSLPLAGGAANGMGFRYTTATPIIATWINTVAAATAGQVWVSLQYVVENRIDEPMF